MYGSIDMTGTLKQQQHPQQKPGNVYGSIDMKGTLKQRQHQQQKRGKFVLHRALPSLREPVIIVQPVTKLSLIHI